MNYPRKVLLIDDDDEEREILDIVLTDCCEWVELLYEKDGGAAMQFIGNMNAPLPDMIFLDWFLPHITGSDLLKAIRKQAHFNHVPVIIFTGALSGTHIDEAKQLGASYFLPKPSNIANFKAELLHIFSLDWKDRAQNI